MNILQNETARNIAHIDNPVLLARRRTELESNPSAFLRSFNLRLLGASIRHPETAKKFADHYLPIGFEYVGAGSSHTAISDGSNVTKINRKTSGLTATQLEDIAGSDKATAREFREALTDSELVIPDTQIGWGVNLLSRKQKSTVLRTQPHLDLIPITIFHPYANDLREDAIRQTDDSVLARLGNIANRALEVHRETGMLLDVTGPGNMSTTGSEIVYINTLPIKNPNEGDITRITSQLTQLASLN